MENKDRPATYSGWKMFEGRCPECGEKVYQVSPKRSQFCSKQCETNYMYRRKNYQGVEREFKPSSDRLRRM